jgi:hypothetical protein
VARTTVDIDLTLPAPYGGARYPIECRIDGLLEYH